jgi:Cu/Zn superoxide dismutase
MSKISRRGLRVTAAAAGAGVIAAAAWAATAHAGPADAATSAPQRAAVVTTRVQLSSMPQGTVAFGRDRRGEVDVTVNASGLTPGSSHRVVLTNGRGVITTFSPLTADSRGRADETLGSRYTGTLGSWQVAVLNGNGSTLVTSLPIARTGDYDGGRHAYQLIPLEIDQRGKDWGTPRGSAVVTYDRTAKTILVTVSASGLEPGRHAAHIHVGSCVSQGPVQYMLTDFTANSRGQIVDQTRVVTHVNIPLPARGWYFNLHQGNSGDILAHGRPTINFRPLLCGDIVSKG